MNHCWNQDFFEDGCTIGVSEESASLEQTPMAAGLKYQRSWSLSLVREVYEHTKSYCSETNKIMETLDAADYARIASHFDKDPVQVMNKMREVLTSGTLRSGKWCRTEDQLMKSLLDDGMSWKDIAVQLNTQIHAGHKIRNIKQCQERWNNHLNPSMKKGNWTLQEDLQLLKLFKIHDRKWTAIAAEVKNRTANSVKNRVHSILMKEKQAVGNTETTDITNSVISNIERALGQKSTTLVLSGVNNPNV